jgi:peroxiredoxin
MTQAHSETPAQAFIRCRDLDASLNERLSAFTESARKFGPGLQAAADRWVERLREHGAGEAAPKPGDEMPPFTLPDEANTLVSLEGLLAKGPVAITFHRGHWCPYCRISMKSLAEAHKKLGGEGQIVAIMPDRQQYASEFKAQTQGHIPILADMDNGYAMSINLAIWVGEEMEAAMKAVGVDPGKSQGNEPWMLPIPATFIVGTNGKISARFLDPDYRRRMALEDLLGELKKAR